MSDVIRPARDVINKANQQINNLPPGVSKKQVGELITAIERNLGSLNSNPAADADLSSIIANQTNRLRRLLGDTSTGKPPPFGVMDSANTVREIGENVLSDYINVQYHVALSMVSFSEAAKMQADMIRDSTSRGINLNDMTLDIRKDKSVTLASTGEVFRNRQNATLFSENIAVGGNDVFFSMDESTFLSDPRNYYNITEIIMENVMAPSTNNPVISQMLTMKMRISEPHGFKFVEDIKRLAFDQGYRFVNHARAVYRVDLWFSGYKMYDKNDSTVPIGTWVDNIPVYNDYNKAGTSVTPLSYYMQMTMAEAELTANGTQYDVHFVPMGGTSFRPEDTVLDAATMKTQGGNINMGGSFGDFLDSLETILPQMRLDSSKNRINRQYKFYAPQWLRDARLGSGADSRLSTVVGALTGSSPGGSPVVNAARGTTVIDLINAACADSEDLRDMWLSDDDGNKGFLVPRIHLSIRFNAKYYTTDGVERPPSIGVVDKDLNDYKNITLEYLLEPYISYKSFTSDEPNKVTEVARPDNQYQRVRNLIKYGMLTRIYNYIWTGLNTEILDLPLNFKLFYYVPLWKSAEDGAATRGKTSGNPASNPYAVTDKLIGDSGVDRLMKQLFGETNNLSQATKVFDATNPYSIFNMGSMNTAPDVDPMLSQTSKRDRLMKYLYYEHDHFENDMLSLEGMSIKGDPIWLLSPYGSARINPLREDSASSGPITVKVQPQTGRVLFLRMNVPNQDDYMGKGFFADGLNKHPHIIGGFYEVTQVTSFFSGGKFTQKVDAVKIANLNFVEELFQYGPNRVYLKAADPSVLGSPDTGRPEPQQTSGPGTVDPRGVGGVNVSRPLTAADVAAADAYFNRTDPNMSGMNLTREQKILVAKMYFLSKGLTDAQANGVVGNLIEESGMVTTIPGDAGTSIGIMQWRDPPGTVNGRKTQLFNFAAQAPSKNPFDLLTQLDFAWHERNTTEKSGWDAALSKGNQSDVTQTFMQKVERPAVQTFSVGRDRASKETQTLTDQARKIREANNIAGQP